MAENIVAFDLETIADPSVIPLLEPVEPDSRLKDPDKISADIAKKEKDQREKLGLDPLTNLICAFGWATPGESGCLMLKDEDSEADLLRQAWDLLAKYDHYITFNGMQFDIRTLRLHSLRHSIIPGVKFDMQRYRIGNQTDLRMILGDWNAMARGKLNFFLKLYFGEGKPEDIDGSMVQDYWDVGMHDLIAEYCEQDAKDTLRLYNHVRTYYL